MRVFLTGATGLLGSHLLEQLLKKDAQVTALVRAIPQKSFLGHYVKTPGSQIELIEGDLDDLSKWQPKVQGDFDAVIHCAALSTVDQSMKSETWRVNFEGTQKLFQEMRTKTQKWVQVSSISTMCNGEDPLVNESFQGHVRKTPYAESKLAADQWLEAQDPDALIVHPCYMLGEWDARPSSGAIFLAMKFKKIESYHNSTKNFVAAKDVAAGILQALEKNAKGHFILGNENLELKEFFALLCSEMNVPFVLKEEVLTENSPDWSKEFCAASAVNWDKARTQLSYQPKTSVKEMLKETMDYFEKNKMLRRAKA